MITVKEKGILINIVKHCKKISDKTTGVNFDYFLNDEDLIQIVCFNILQIGELAKNLDLDFIKKYNEVPWKQIKGMRDKVAHGYGTIDVERIWGTAINDIEPLEKYCDKILNAN